MAKKNTKGLSGQDWANANNKKSVNTYIDIGVYNKIKVIAQKEDRTLSKQIERLIVACIASYKESK